MQSGQTSSEGVSALIPVANITLEDALLDNPNFRANIKLFEGQVFFIETWLNAFHRALNQVTDEWIRLNEVTSQLNKRAELPLLSQGMLSSQYTIPAMKLLSDAIRTTLALKSKYISEVSEKVAKPLEEFLKNDLKEFKDSKKSFDKALEKYESTLAKYNGQSRQKEPSAIREEAFQLYDTRKAYIQASLSCSMICIKFQDALDQLVLGVFLDLIATQHDFFSENADHYGSIGLQVLQLKTYMREHQKASIPTLQELEQNKERYITDSLEYWKPSRSLKSYTNNISTPKSAINSATLGSSFATQIMGQTLAPNAIRPSTISFSATTPTSRSPILAQQFQSQSPSPVNGTTVSEEQKSQILSSETNPAQESLTINTSAVKTPNSLSSSPLPYSKSDPNMPQTATPPISGVVQSSLEDITPTTKQGYLNIRIPQPRNRAPVWQRKYFFIQEGEFGFESVVSNPTVGSQVVQSERIAVLLCEVRYGSSSNSLVTLGGNGNPATGSQGLAMVQMERRFCFEVVCSTQSYLLQAETEEDLLSWVNTFEASKRDMLLQQCLPGKSEPEEPYSPMLDSAHPSFSFSGEDLMKTAMSKSNENLGESRSLGPLGWAANMPGVSLLLNSYNGNTSDKDESDTSPDSNTLIPVQSSVATLTEGTDSPPNRSTSSSDPPVSGEQRSGPSQQVSEIEKLMTSSLHLVPKARPPFVSEIPHYPLELAVRNRELHVRFHGTKVRSTEYVLHSWTSGYRDNARTDKPIMVYGRIYLTQSGMYFYARGLSVETKRMFRFSNVRGIECEQKDISTEWRIETMNGEEHVFNQFTLADTEYQILHLIWTNVHVTKDRLPVKELFRKTLLITNKPKGSAGSGSLAETESGHNTSREGVMTYSSGRSNDPSAEGRDSEDTNDTDLVVPGEDFPEGIEVPSGPVSCNCPGHLEKLELEQTFEMSAKTLSRLLFGKDSPIWKEFHERRNNTLQSVGEWEPSSDGLKARTVKFLMVVNNPLVKLNQTDCVESQTCDVEEDYLRYTYTVKSSVLAMPYSDAFTPVLRYCITFVSKDSCKLTCSSGIIWHKSPMVKAMIKGAILKGTAETVKDLLEIIQLQSAKLKKQSSSKRSTPGSNGGNTEQNHTRSDSSKIMISLHGPDDAHKVLLDPEDQNGSDVSSSNHRDIRLPGARRHTVSTLSNQSQGVWPPGSSPTFPTLGSKASHTRLLKRPSKSSLTNAEGSSDKAKLNSPKGVIQWTRNALLGFVNSKEDNGKQSNSTKFLFLVLMISSFVNILAVYNSQRMLDSAWKIKEHGSLMKSKSTAQGYSEPLYRILGHGHGGVEGLNQQERRRNVRVAARAVYLKDLEEQMQSGELDDFDGGHTIDQKCFEIFMEVRDSFRPWPEPPLEWLSDQSQNGSQQQEPHASTSTSLSIAKPTGTPLVSELYGEPDTAESTRYPWLLPRHRQWATKVIFQRDRVGILRHDLLVTFEILKQLERRLLETEYINWIMDEQSRCRLWKRRRENRLAREHELRNSKTQDSPSRMESGNVDAPIKGDTGDRTTAEGIKERIEEKRLKKEYITRQISRLRNELNNLADRNVKGEGVASIHGVLRYLEMQSQDVEQNDEQIGDVNYGAEDLHDEITQSLLSEDQLAQEFCEGLGRQVELFMLDPKE